MVPAERIVNMEGEEEQQHAQQIRSTARRDQLTLYQTIAQKQWLESKVFEVDASTKDEKTIKFFGNFPYPYTVSYTHLTLPTILRV